MTVIFFFSVFTCIEKSVLNIKVSIYTSAVHTEQQGQKKKVGRTKGKQKLKKKIKKLPEVGNYSTPRSSCEKWCEDFIIVLQK